jgi:hypothetical protein
MRSPALVRRLVHAADRDELVVELHDRVGQACTQDILAKAATGGGGAGLATFGLFGRGSDAVLVSGIVSSELDGILHPIGNAALSFRPRSYVMYYLRHFVDDPLHER